MFARLLQYSSRARETALFRSAPLFADTSAHGKRVNLRLCNLCEALKISRKEGENAAQPLFKRRSAVSPSKSDEIFSSARKDFAERC